MRPTPPRAFVPVAAVLALLLSPWGPRASGAAEFPQTAAIFLELDGVAGESADPQHKGHIEVVSFSLSAQRGGGEADKPNLNDFFILKPIDAASPKLLIACASGQKFSKATVTVRGGSGGKEPREYLKYTFTDLAVSRVSNVVSGGGQEEVNFRYGSVQIEYTAADGTVTKQGWDVKGNRAMP